MMNNPWLQMMQAMTPNMCAPQKLGGSLPLPWPWGPMWQATMDPDRNPYLAMGMAFGPVAWMAAWAAMFDEDTGEKAALATERMSDGVPV